MNIVWLLTRRNLTLFFRDRMQVFFALLSPLILVALYALFLGSLQVDNLKLVVPSAGDHDVTWFVTTWVFAGVLTITTLTTSLGAVAIFVDDRVSGRFSDFIVSPLRRSQLVLGYLISSFIVTILVSLVVFGLGEIFLLIQGDRLMDVGQTIQLILYLALCSLAFAAFYSFAVTFLTSPGAFVAISTVLGTVLGFIAGAYIPAGTLGTGITNVINALPFAQSAMLIRGPLTHDALDAVTGGQPQLTDALQEFYGITGKIGDIDVTVPFAIVSLILVFVVFTGLAVWRLARTIR